ncbi:MAG: ABC-ATPase domain-containing protein [bacterium]|nr:ABC-ATPase domain-containing protein [bacterium]
MSRTGATLERDCLRLDGRGYPAYKDLQGAYTFDRFTLHVDHVQGDPFAAPSKLRVRVAMEVAAVPAELLRSRTRRMALADFIARKIRDTIGTPPDLDEHPRNGRGKREGSGKSGLVRIDAGAQEVLERTAVRITDDWLEARLEVGLPANGRRILGERARQLLCETLPQVALAGLQFDSLDRGLVTSFVHCVENQEAIRQQLRQLGLIAFVGNGAVLPRESGASDRPLRSDDVVRFLSPSAFEVSIDVPNPTSDAASHRLVGMGVPKGVNLIVGGGYHGKSTLLQALERCVYPHIPGDGRETVVADRGLVKVCAEDGRRIERVDIHPFIGELPGGRSTRAFCSDNASGSTSQAAGIVEAIEAGCSGLLLDEDTCATNFMVRDARMQALVHKDFEPITPLVDRIGELHRTLDVSTVIVMGGCGDYFEVADRVIMLRDYLPRDATADAKKIARANPGERNREVTDTLEPPRPRVPTASSFDASRGRRRVKIDARGRDAMSYGREDLDLRGVSQLVDTSQTRATGLAIHRASERSMKPGVTLTEVLDELEQLIDREGLDAVSPFSTREQHPGNLARPRRHEIAAAINRLRGLRMTTG